jgi:hypothetical protein
MSHSFSFLYQGIHKYKRQPLLSFFGDLSRPLNVDFYRLFSATYRRLFGVT